MNKITNFLCLSLLLLGATALGMDPVYAYPGIQTRQATPGAVIDQGEELIDAAKRGNLDEVERLLGQEVSIEAKDHSESTPLIWAARRGHEAMCEFLIANKASIEAKDNNGKTSLNWAAKYGCQNICKLLIANKALVDAKDSNGTTPLISAATFGQKETCQLLIDHKAQIDGEDNLGWTPLMHAALEGEEEVCKLLINATIKQMDKAAAITLLGMRRFNRTTCMNGMDRNVMQLIARHVVDAETKRLFALINAAKYEILFAQINTISDETTHGNIRTYAKEQLKLKMDPETNRWDSHE